MGPHSYTDIELHNLRHGEKLALTIFFTPDPKIHSKLTQLAFFEFIQLFQPFIIGQNLGAKMALNLIYHS